MNRLRALTLIRPMAAAIVHGSKRIENRPVNLPRAMRGVPTIVAVHAGKKWDDEYWATVLRVDGDGISLPYGDHVGDEGIVGLMRLTGRVFTEAPYVPYPSPLRAMRRDPWFSGPFGYEIDAVVAFPSPIPCRGMQGFWPVPEAIADMISDAGPFAEFEEAA